MSIGLRRSALVAMLPLLLSPSLGLAGALGGSPSPAFDPANSSGYQAMERIEARDKLIKDAGWFGPARNWDRIAFDVWTARAPGGRGVRLSTAAYPALADDPMAPTWIHVSRSTLRAVIERFLDRREIEIANHTPRENAMRNGVSGWVGASEWSEGAPVPAPVFASHMLPSEAETVGRELVDFLFWTDLGASGRVKNALALGKRTKKAGPMAPLAYVGTPPLAITLVPTTGEDFARSTLLVSRRAMSMHQETFTGKDRSRCDVDLTMRGGWYTADEGDDDVAASAALLELAAAPGGAPCDPLPQYPAWPPTWRVRVFDRMDGNVAHVAREFDVPVSVVRCRALARFDAIHNIDDHLRSAMQTLSELGVDRIEPDGSAPPPPQHMAPEAARAALLALARGPSLQPRTARLDVSLTDGRRVLVRLADLADRPAALRKSDDFAIALDDAALRAVLLAALSHPAIGPGLARTPSAHPQGAEYREIRVLERYAGLRYSVPVLIAYLPSTDADAVARSMVRALEPHDAAAASRLRSTIGLAYASSGRGF